MGVYGTGKDPKLPMASAEDVDEMLDALENLSSKLVAAFPDTCRPELYKPPSEGNSVHSMLLSICNEEVSKAVLGNTLTTQVGSTGGNRALGEVHENSETKIARFDALQLSATLRRDLLVPLVELNGWSALEAPSIVFTVEPPENQDALASRFKTLAESGVEIEQAHVRDCMAIPEPLPGQPVIGRKTDAKPNKEN
jgi:phage gp29-like protein